jgi:hypothetical protein
MNQILSDDDILEALISSKSGTAASLNGIPYNLWKLLHKKHTEMEGGKKPSFNIIETMTLVMKDIQTHGINNNSLFTVRWMCPLYKKKTELKLKTTIQLPFST